MRRSLLVLPLLLLSACEMASTQPKPVDLATLPPMSGKERALMAAAEGALRQGNRAGAERDYLEAVAASEGHIDAHLSLAALYDGQKQLAKAEPVLERARGFQPHHPRVTYLLGKLALQKNKPELALERFNAGLSASPDDLDLLNGAGTAHDMLRQNAQAQALYRRALNQHPKADLTMIRTNLAMSYLLSNQPKKAIDLLKADAKKPDASPVTRHNLALAYGMLGKNAEARALVSKDMSEDERKLALERLKLYVSQPEPAGAPPAVVRN